MVKSLLLITLFFVILCACKKDVEFEDTCNTNNSLHLGTNANSNGYVSEGWPFWIEYTKDTYTKIEITGPNGYAYTFSDENSISSSITIDSSTLANSGQYSLELWDHECRKGKGILNVTIVPNPPPPCILVDNSATTTIPNIGPTVWSYVYGHPLLGEYYQVYGINSMNKRINFTFNGTSKPRVGKYTTYGGTYPEQNNPRECAVNMQYNNGTYKMKDDQEIYVTEENGNLVFTMCSSEFDYSSGGTQLYLSTKLVLQ